MIGQDQFAILNGVWALEECLTCRVGVLSVPVFKKFYVITDPEATKLAKAMSAAERVGSSVMKAIQLLDDCDVSVPADRRAALARVKDVLSGGGGK